MKNLAMWRAVGAAYAFVFVKPLRFAAAAWPWLGLAIALPFLPPAFGLRLPLHARPPHIGTILPVPALTFIGGIAVLVTVAVALHRSIVADDMSWVAPLRFGRRQWRFLGNGLIIAVAMAVPLFFAEPLVGAIMLALSQPGSVPFLSPRFLIAAEVMVWAPWLAVWIYASRLMLALPAASVDQRGALSGVWDLSEADRWRLYCGSILCAVPIELLRAAIPTIFTAFGVGGKSVQISSGIKIIEHHWSPIVYGSSAGLLILGLVVPIAFYSYAYRQLADGLATRSDLQPQSQPAE